MTIGAVAQAAICTLADAQCLPQMEELDLRSSAELDHQILARIGQRAVMLRSISLTCFSTGSQFNSSFDVGDTGVVALLAGSPCVEELVLDGCNTLTDAVLHTIALRCPHLRRLEVRNGCKFTDTGIVTLSEVCHALKSLVLCWCPNMTDMAVLAIAQNLPRLTLLKMIIADEMCCGAKVQQVHNTCTDVALTALSTHCRQLHTLHLKYCDITDSGLRLVALGCTQLQDVDVEYCPQVTDTGIGAVASGCRYLRRLGLTGTQATDRALCAVLHKCTSLQYLTLGRRVLQPSLLSQNGETLLSYVQHLQGS